MKILSNVKKYFFLVQVNCENYLLFICLKIYKYSYIIFGVFFVITCFDLCWQCFIVLAESSVFIMEFQQKVLELQSQVFDLMAKLDTLNNNPSSNWITWVYEYFLKGWYRWKISSIQSELNHIEFHIQELSKLSVSDQSVYMQNLKTQSETETSSSLEDAFEQREQEHEAHVVQQRIDVKQVLENEHAYLKDRKKVFNQYVDSRYNLQGSWEEIRVLEKNIDVYMETLEKLDKWNSRLTEIEKFREESDDIKRTNEIFETYKDKYYSMKVEERILGDQIRDELDTRVNKK